MRNKLLLFLSYLVYSILFVTVQEWPRGATPHPRSGAMAERSYPKSQVRGYDQEEPPHV